MSTEPLPASYISVFSHDYVVQTLIYLRQKDEIHDITALNNIGVGLNVFFLTNTYSNDVNYSFSNIAKCAVQNVIRKLIKEVKHLNRCDILLNVT